MENPGDGKEREVRAGGRLTKQRQSQLGQWWGECGLVPEEGAPKARVRRGNGN